MVQGVFTWSGISNVISAKYTQGHGVTPDVINVEMVPQAVNTFAAYGTATFSYAGVTVPLNECLVDQASLRLDANAHIGHLRIFDRRWKWRAGGEINGTYNVKEDNGSLIAATAKTAQELAELCLLAMGETSYSVTALPSAAYPAVKWIGAHPATELQELCDQYGCAVVLGYGTDPVTVVQLGTGLGAPANSDAIAVNAGLDTDAAPDSIKLYGGPYTFEGMFALQAVAPDLDGYVRPIGQLSYRPSVPGGAMDTDSFEYILLGNTAVTLNDTAKLRAYDLARKYVFKQYAPTGLAGGFTLAGLPYIGALGVTVSGMDDVDLLPWRFDVNVDANGTNTVRLDAEVYGECAIRHLDTEQPGVDSLGNTDISTVLPTIQTPFRLLSDNTVMFESRVFAINSVGGSSTATTRVGAQRLFLHCAFTVSDSSNFYVPRYTYLDNIRSVALGTGPKVVHKGELVPYVQLNYNYSAVLGSADRLPSSSGTGPVGTATYTDNTATLNTEAALWTAAEKAQYATNVMGWTLYRGLQAVRCDGNIRQVSWRVSSKEGASTVVSVSTESDPFVIPAEQRRRIAWSDKGFRNRSLKHNSWRDRTAQWRRTRREQ